MNNITTISTKGQVTIPDHIRSALNINSGDKALFESFDPENDTVSFKIHRKPNVKKIAGALYRPNQKYVPLKIAREIAANNMINTEWHERGLISLPSSK